MHNQSTRKVMLWRIDCGKRTGCLENLSAAGHEAKLIVAESDRMQSARSVLCTPIFVKHTHDDRMLRDRTHQKLRVGRLPGVPNPPIGDEYQRKQRGIRGANPTSRLTASRDV
jgi:hypothetical protein